ncbi:MAG: type IV toxin-antitoxin system AbiEi family antitoxin domain-containing protein [Acidobacteriota bacterium]
MGTLGGLGSLDRERLGRILRATRGTISVSDAVRSLGKTPREAAKLLARWARKGWIARVRRGLYVPLALESQVAEAVLEDPWAVAMRLYESCYIGGLSAAEHWDLTEQVYRTVVVLTTKKTRSRNQEVAGTNFLLKTVPETALFGLSVVWRGQTKVSVSDPSRTLADLLADPSLGGGIRSVRDMLQAYLRSTNKNLPLLLEYARRLGNGAVFKRLGLLLEELAPAEDAALDDCRRGLTAGYAHLDPMRRGSRLISRWRVWVPENWMKGGRGD